MYEYFVEVPKMVELKKELERYTGIKQGRLKKLFDILGDVDDFKHPLMYDSSIRGRFESPMTTDEFLKSIEEKRKEIKVRKK